MNTKLCTGTTRVWLLAAFAGLAAAPAAMADKTVGAPARSVGIDRTGLAVMASADNVLAPGQTEEISFSNRVECTSTACVGSVQPNLVAPGIPNQGQTSALWSDFGGPVPVNPQQQLDSRVANNFTPTATGSVSEVCWAGRYTLYLPGVAPTSTAPAAAFGLTAPPATRTFRISYYNDAGGFPCPTPIAQFVVGATNPTAGTDFTVSGLLSGSNPSLTQTRRFSAQHPPVPVTGGSCLWVEIIDIDNPAPITANGTPGYISTFRWICTFSATANATAGPNTRPDDDRCFFGLFNLGTADGTPYSTAEEELGSGDPMFCVSSAIAAPGAGTCPTVPTTTPGNDEVTNPTALTVGGASISGTLFGASQDIGGVRPCGGSMGDGAGVWYTVAGNGQTLTVNTDFPTNCTDTLIIVYNSNGSTNAADWSCIGDDDDASATLGSTVTWCSDPAASYLIYVAGAFNGGGWGEGNFQIQVTQSGACTPASPSLNCDVVAQVGDLLEVGEACGGGLDVNGECNGNPDVTTPATIALDGTGRVGTMETVFQTSRDFDCWNFTTTGETELSVSLFSEFPAAFFLVECTTTAPATFPSINDAGAEQIFGLAIPTCITGEALQVVVPRAGNWVFLVTAAQFGGLEDCSLPFNQYRLAVSVAPTGACCDGTSCSVAQEIGCNNNNGRFIGDNVLCSAGDCVPACAPLALGTPAEAETCLVDPQTSVNDDCVTPAGTLAAGTPVYGTLSTAALLAGNFRDLDAWTLTVAAAGDVDIVLEAESNVLFQLINCATQLVVPGSTNNVARCTTAATTVPAVPAGTYIVIVTTQDFEGAGCGSGVNNYKLSLGGGQTPCQLADFNDVDGVTADDIFAFLDAWFAQNGVCVSPATCTADINGVDDVTADDIFAFLDLWFTFNGTNPCP